MGKSDKYFEFGYLGQSIGFMLRRIQISMFKEFSGLLEKRMTLAPNQRNITPGETGLLILVSFNPGFSQTAFSKIVGVERSTMTDVIDRLEKIGLLERRQDPNDRRSRALYLTEYGEVFVGTLGKTVKKMERDFTKCLDRDEKRTLIKLLSKLHASSQGGNQPD